MIAVLFVPRNSWLRESVCVYTDVLLTTRPFVFHVDVFDRLELERYKMISYTSNY